jgi:ABC-type nitrate/sulfonate/bicarbonate transport system substrate-binding protein
LDKFLIAPHMRLHEWVAEEKGYFDDEGLDYEYVEQLSKKNAKAHDLGDKVGAYQTFEKGRSCDVSSACHWTVNIAASAGHGQIYTDAYSVSPCGIFVHPDSGIEKPEDLAGVPISVGYQSGSHYSTIQALEQFLKPEEINLSFNDGLLFARMEKLIDGEVPACSLFSGTYYFLDQLGFKKIVETTFMMAGMITGDPDSADIAKYYRALKKAQHDIDLRPELYVHFYKEEFPERFHPMMDLRYFGPGERIVFDSYSQQMYDQSRTWVSERDIFPDGDIGDRAYDSARYIPAAE